MTPQRFEKIGIQRELHLDWFDQAARLYGTGLSKTEARQEIYVYLSTSPAFASPPSQQSKTYIANPLIKTWIAPEAHLIAWRNEAYPLLQDVPDSRLPLHWSILGAAYPFWFAVATVVGRLLGLQKQVTQAQIVSRLKEHYGDRQTVSRRARYVIRSFVNWGVLKDSETRGCYEKVASLHQVDSRQAVFMLEAALLAVPEGKGALGLFLNHPAFFPFQIPVVSGDWITQHSQRMEALRYGLDEELLVLKGNHRKE